MGDIDFKVISTIENSNKFPKNQVLEGKKSAESVVNIGPMAEARHTSMCYICTEKKN